MIDQRFKRHDLSSLPPMCFFALWEISEIYASVRTAAKKLFRQPSDEPRWTFDKD